MTRRRAALERARLPLSLDATAYKRIAARLGARRHAHALWELRATEGEGDELALVRRHEERLVDLRGSHGDHPRLDTRAERDGDHRGVFGFTLESGVEGENDSTMGLTKRRTFPTNRSVRGSLKSHPTPTPENPYLPYGAEGDPTYRPHPNFYVASHGELGPIPMGHDAATPADYAKSLGLATALGFGGYQMTAPGDATTQPTQPTQTAPAPAPTPRTPSPFTYSPGPDPLDQAVDRATATPTTAPAKSYTPEQVGWWGDADPEDLLEEFQFAHDGVSLENLDLGDPNERNDIEGSLVTWLMETYDFANADAQTAASNLLDQYVTGYKERPTDAEDEATLMGREYEPAQVDTATGTPIMNEPRAPLRPAGPDDSTYGTELMRGGGLRVTTTNNPWAARVAMKDEAMSKCGEPGYTCGDKSCEACSTTKTARQRIITAVIGGRVAQGIVLDVLPLGDLLADFGNGPEALPEEMILEDSEVCADCDCAPCECELAGYEDEAEENAEDRDDTEADDQDQDDDDDDQDDDDLIDLAAHEGLDEDHVDPFDALLGEDEDAEIDMALGGGNGEPMVLVITLEDGMDELLG